MATKHTSTTHHGAGGTAEISIFALSIKGGEAVVHSAIQQFAKAGFAVALPQTPKPPPVALQPAPASNSLQPEPPAEPRNDGDSSHVETAEIAVPASAPNSSRPARKRTYAVPDILDDLKANEEPAPFKSFVAGRNITSDIDRALVAITWLKEKRDVVHVRTDHLHTCFVMDGWKLPEDPSSLLRNLKKGQFVRPVIGKPGTFEITTKGANRYAEISNAATA